MKKTNIKRIFLLMSAGLFVLTFILVNVQISDAKAYTSAIQLRQTTYDNMSHDQLARALCISDCEHFNASWANCDYAFDILNVVTYPWNDKVVIEYSCFYGCKSPNFVTLSKRQGGGSSSVATPKYYVVTRSGEKDIDACSVYYVASCCEMSYAAIKSSCTEGADVFINWGSCGSTYIDMSDFCGN